MSRAMASRFPGRRKFCEASAGFLLLFHVFHLTEASVTIKTKDDTSTHSFADADAAFGGMIPSGGITGHLHRASPLDACTPLLNSIATGETAFVLISRGNCVFDKKVRNAQVAGFSAAIVFNNEHGRELITMSGLETFDIRIPAVFVTNDSGKELLSVVDMLLDYCIITPSFESTAWSVMAVSFISLLAVSAVLMTFFFVRRHRLRRIGSSLLLMRESSGMSAREVKALPSFTYKEGVENPNSASPWETCAICLEDYEDGEKLRVLPCRHEFHVPCIDQWLTTRRPFCPVCKRDAHGSSTAETPSEWTPLLSDPSRSPHTDALPPLSELPDSAAAPLEQVVIVEERDLEENMEVVNLPPESDAPTTEAATGAALQ